MSGEPKFVRQEDGQSRAVIKTDEELAAEEALKDPKAKPAEEAAAAAPAKAKKGK